MACQREQGQQTGGPESPPPGTGYERRWVGHAALALVCLLFVGLVGRLAYIQVTMRPTLLAWSEARLTSEVVLPGRRGMIFDRRGRTLAGSHDAVTVYAHPHLVEDYDEAAARLAEPLGMSPAEIRGLLDHPRSRRYVVLKRALPMSVAERVRSLNLPGVGVITEPVRTYPMARLAAHVLGFMGADRQGLEGIERTMDRYLRPQDGKRVVYRDVKRRAIFEQPDSYVPPRDGMHVVLTLDAAIQEMVERQLAATVDQFKAESALCVVLSPKNGAVLAMGCHPTFDPGWSMFRQPGAERLARWIYRNRVITDPVEPGSIFKPFVMTGALAAKLCRPEESIYCHSGLYVTGSRRLRDHHAYGNLSVVEIMTKSSNIGMAILGQRMGNARLYETLSTFGFGRRTGIDLPGESPGVMLPLRRWTSFSTTSVPMGQEMASTPIQLVTAFAMLANGGKTVRPRVVEAVIDAEGQVVEDFRPAGEPPQVLDAAAVETMRQILVRVVNEGTGKPCRLDRWQVMGKTGTAQIPRYGHRGYEDGAYLASFIAAAPASDPQVVVLLMVRKPNPRIAYYGGAVAAPGVKNILEQVLEYLNVPPDLAPQPSTPSRLVLRERMDNDLHD